MDRELRVAKSGNTYWNYYQKTGKPRTGRIPRGKTLLNINAKSCLERDNYKCVLCGSTKNLKAHHKDHLGNHIAKYNTDDSLGNLITLCAKCHIRLHFNVLDRDDSKIAVRHNNGETFQSIADSIGVSRQRICQIYYSLSKKKT